MDETLCALALSRLPGIGTATALKLYRAAGSAAAETNGVGDIDLSGLDTQELDSSVNGLGSIKRPKGLSR